jgi:DNA-binding NtrC family response regulator
MTFADKSLRVLVVDDELLIRWSIAEMLTQHGHLVVEATSASSAREVMGRGEPIDVVLLDYRLPDSDNLRLLADVRARMPDAAVVLMTAYGTPEVARGALQLGAYRVIDKPFDMHDVDALVRSAYQAAHRMS